MREIFYLPLESMEQRYSKMMNHAINQHIFNCDAILYPSIPMPSKIKKGQFLDITATIRFKAAQLEMVAGLFDRGRVKDGDVFLVADMFFPGIESIKYMAELLGIKVKLAGFNYAGRADKNDFVRKLGKWADVCEQGYHEVFDLIFVGSDYHKDQVVGYFKQPSTKVHTTGYIWDESYVEGLWPLAAPRSEEANYTIWPHRPCAEKGVDDFLNYVSDNEDMKFLVTSCGNPDVGFASALPSNVEYIANLSKVGYYRYLSNASRYLSTAYQETFGYTLQEAIYYGVEIAVPNRACYPEMVPFKNLYKTIHQINSAYSVVDRFHCNRWDGNAERIFRTLRNL